jgi:hypothetical protein
VRIALFFGVTLGRPEAFDRIISAKEPKKLPVGYCQDNGMAGETRRG